MSKKQKRRQGRGSRTGGAPQTPTPALAGQAGEALAAQRWRDAIQAYKELLKRENNADWRSALADAYAGRAGELSAKGMLKEALAIWQNRAALEPAAPMAPGHAALLMHLGQPEAVIGLLGGDDGSALPREQREQIRSQLAARVLGGDRALLERLPEDEPVRRHAEPALAALAGYCGHDDEAVQTALAAIPFRSPYRDWVQIIKALLRQPTAPVDARAALERIDDGSAFAPLKRAALLSLLPESQFLDAAETMGPTELRVAAVLRGWPPERIAVWQELHRLGREPPPKALIRLLNNHQGTLGADWVRRKSLSLIAEDGSSEGLHWLREAGGSHPSRFEQALLAAWTTEPHRDPWMALEHWRHCAHLLERRWHDSKDPDLALRIALLLRRSDVEGDMLGGPHKPSGDPDYFDSIAAEHLEASLSWDPDDRATYLRLIDYYRRGRRLKDARRLLEQAQARWPQDMGLLEAALDIALDAGSFKKAAGLARRILDIDPINSGVRRRLVNAHLAHARKQVAKNRSDLARKELAESTNWARDEALRTRIALMTELLSVLEDDREGIQALRDRVNAQDTALADRLELALATDAIGLRLGKVNSQLQLKRPTVRDRDDLAAVLARLRGALDEDRAPSPETRKMLEAALPKAPWESLSRTELETACDTLKRQQLDKTRQRAATAALKRWRGAPIFELHRFEAKYPHGFDFRAMKDLWVLEGARDRARDEGDMRTAMRIDEALSATAGLGGLSGPPAVFPPFESGPESEMEEGLPAHIIEMIRVVGLKKMLQMIGAPPELNLQIKDIERILGEEAAMELLIQFLTDGAEFDPFEALPFPPEPKPKPKRGRTKSPPRDDDDDPPDQLDLF